MKNVTLSIDDETYRLARIAAAERDTTVSAMVREYLRQVATRKSAEANSSESLFEALDKARDFSAGKRLTRDEAHDRSRLR